MKLITLWSCFTFVKPFIHSTNLICQDNESSIIIKRYNQYPYIEQILKNFKFSNQSYYQSV